MKHKHDDDVPETEPHVFDQTNGVVDLGTESERPDANKERDEALRTSSINATAITYANGR